MYDGTPWNYRGRILLRTSIDGDGVGVEPNHTTARKPAVLFKSLNTFCLHRKALVENIEMHVIVGLLCHDGITHYWKYHLTFREDEIIFPKYCFSRSRVKVSA